MDYRTVANVNATMRKLNSFNTNLSRLNAGFSRYDQVVTKINRVCSPISQVSVSSVDPSRGLDGSVRQLTSGLSRGQRGWLAKGIQSWSRAFSTPSQSNPPGTQARLHNLYLLDLATFLERRHLQSIRKRSTWVRGGPRAIRMRAWFLEIKHSLLPRLASALTPSGVSRELLAVLKAPPGWAEAVRFRYGLEAAIPKMLARLASVISPNAPARLDLPRRQRPGGGPLLLTI